MNIQTIKRSMISVLKNLPGKSFHRKIIILECDDWGSIGMPSKTIFNKLKAAGLPVENSRYSRYDTLAGPEDLEALFTVLKKNKDKNGNHAVMSPFCNMANPDFEKIKENKFQEYHREVFTDTYTRYEMGPNLMKVWKEGISEGVFAPEYHGREHISTALWLKSLRSGDEKLRLAFDHGFVSYSPAGIPVVAADFRPNFYLEDKEALQDLRSGMEEGIDIFKRSFGFSPTVFNAPNAVFIPEFNQSLLKKGIKFNAVPRKRLDRNHQGSYEWQTFKTGQKSAEGLTYYVRNCNFEPTEPGYTMQHVMSQINAAFLCGKPAVIGTHRVNFVGALSESNRKQGLSRLDHLLQTILAKWPDAEFMSSRKFTSLLS